MHFHGDMLEYHNVIRCNLLLNVYVLKIIFATKLIKINTKSVCLNKSVCYHVKRQCTIFFIKQQSFVIECRNFKKIKNALIGRGR